MNLTWKRGNLFHWTLSMILTHIGVVSKANSAESIPCCFSTLIKLSKNVKKSWLSTRLKRKLLARSTLLSCWSRVRLMKSLDATRLLVPLYTLILEKSFLSIWECLALSCLMYPWSSLYFSHPIKLPFSTLLSKAWTRPIMQVWTTETEMLQVLILYKIWAKAMVQLWQVQSLLLFTLGEYLHQLSKNWQDPH